MALIEKKLLLGPLEYHDDVRKRSLKQKCFQLSPEWIQWLSRCKFCKAGCSTREVQQPGKLGCRQMTAWHEAPRGNRCWRRGVVDGIPRKYWNTTDALHMPRRIVLSLLPNHTAVADLMRTNCGGEFFVNGTKNSKVVLFKCTALLSHTSSRLQ